MPPLAHILAPLIARKAQEIEDEIGPPPGYLREPRNQYGQPAGTPPGGTNRDGRPFGGITASELFMQYTGPRAAGRGAVEGAAAAGSPKKTKARPKTADASPRSVGYLNAGYEKTPYDPKGLINKKDQVYDAHTPGGKQLAWIGQMQRSGNPFLKAAAERYLRDTDTSPKYAPGKVRTMPNAEPTERTKAFYKPEWIPAEGAESTVIKLTPEQAKGVSERDMRESARTYDAAHPRWEKKGKTIIQLDPHAAVGVTESGAPVDAKGRKKPLGYLKAPVIGTQHGDLGAGARTLERNKKDHYIIPYDQSKPHLGDTLRPNDAFGKSVLQQEFGDDLKVMQENRDERGMPTDKFPAGYLDHLPKNKQQAIHDAVKILQNLEREGPMI